MVQKYLSGLSAPKTAKLFGFSRQAVYDALENYDFEPRPAAGSNRKYPLNENYFEEIDTEEKAYWIGFILADGYILYDETKYTYILGIVLHQKDRIHLEKLNKELSSNRPIFDSIAYSKKRNKFYERSFIHVASKKLVSDLIKLGFTPRKSLTAKPIAVPLHLRRHYFRGLIDGDGCISHSLDKRDNKIYWKVNLVGTKDILEDFSMFIASNLDCNVLEPRPRKKIFSITYGGIDKPADVSKLLYEGSSIHLDRKKELANELELFRNEISLSKMISKETE